MIGLVYSFRSVLIIIRMAVNDDADGGCGIPDANIVDLGIIYVNFHQKYCLPNFDK